MNALPRKLLIAGTVAVISALLCETGAFGQCAAGTCTSGASSRTAAHAQNPAIVRVWADTGGGSRSGGSGSLIAEDETGRGLVITNRHVVDGGNGFEVHWPTGEVSRAKLIGVGNGEDDLAALFVTVPDGIDPLELREEEPRAGETLWIAGYGGSSFSYGPGDYNPWNEVNASIEGTPARHGDSGGPIVDSKGRVSGVLWGSNFTDHTVCIRLPRVRKFLRGVGKVAKWAVGPCCSGSTSSRSGGQRFIDAPEVLGGNGDPEDLDEPGLPEPAPEKPKPDPSIALIKSQLSDISKQLAEIKDRKPEPGPPGAVGPQGPAGPQGEPGPAGKDADPEQVIALNARMEILERELEAARANQPEPVEGSGSALAGDAKISHIVLLVDKNAPEWQRIAATFLSRAQDHLPVHVVDYSAVPWKVRQLPQAVVYNTAHEAVSVAKGARDVEMTLAAVDRGDLQ